MLNEGLSPRASATSSAAGFRFATGIFYCLFLRQTHLRREFREGLDFVGHCHGIDEVILEFCLKRGFDLLDVCNRFFDLAAEIPVKEGHFGAITRSDAN